MWTRRGIILTHYDFNFFMKGGIAKLEPGAMIVLQIDIHPFGKFSTSDEPFFEKHGK